MFPRPLRLHAMAALVLALGGSGPAAAGWVPEGVLLCSNCRARFPQIAADGAGGRLRRLDGRAERSSDRVQG